MKAVGYILIAFGIALLIFVGYSFIKERGQVHSPLPEDRGVKVIFITPDQER